MTLPLSRSNIFTERDERLTLGTDADPLGLRLIWTYYGQKIYNNKINSATFDLRNFNIVLFNHLITYKLKNKETNIELK